MSYDENRISDQIDGGLNEREQMSKRIEYLESKLKAVEEKVINGMEYVDDFSDGGVALSNIMNELKKQ